MVNYILLVVFVMCSQIIFNYLRTMEIKFIMKGMVKETLIVAFFISITVLSSTYISFKALLDGDYFMAGVFVIFGLIGKYLGMTEYKMKEMKRFFTFKKKCKKNQSKSSK